MNDDLPISRPFVDISQPAELVEELKFTSDTSANTLVLEVCLTQHGYLEDGNQCL